MKVFESSDYQNNWDGRFSGEYVAEGTYYYQVEASELSGVQKGTINVLH